MGEKKGYAGFAVQERIDTNIFVSKTEENVWFTVNLGAIYSVYYLDFFMLTFTDNLKVYITNSSKIFDNPIITSKLCNDRESAGSTTISYLFLYCSTHYFGEYVYIRTRIKLKIGKLEIGGLYSSEGSKIELKI